MQNINIKSYGTVDTTEIIVVDSGVGPLSVGAASVGATSLLLVGGGV